MMEQCSTDNRGPGLDSPHSASYYIVILQCCLASLLKIPRTSTHATTLEKRALCQIDRKLREFTSPSSSCVCLFTWLPFKPSHGSWPWLNISHRVTPNIHVSLAWEKVLVLRLSGAHLHKTHRSQPPWANTGAGQMMMMGEEINITRKNAACETVREMCDCMCDYVCDCVCVLGGGECMITYVVCVCVLSNMCLEGLVFRVSKWQTVWEGWYGNGCHLIKIYQDYQERWRETLPMSASAHQAKGTLWCSCMT